MSPDRNEQDVNRRDFIKSSSLSTFMMMIGGVELKADDKKPEENKPELSLEEKYVAPPVSCAIIGCGLWGRDQIANTLATLPNAPVVAICDSYAPFLKRAQTSAPKAEPFSDYRKLLDSKAVQAVLIATPSHQHKEIVLAALQAGEPVYFEAPLPH